MPAGAEPIIVFARRSIAQRRCEVKGGTMSENKKDMDRREFLATTAAVGGAMVVGFWMPGATAEAAGTTSAAVSPQPWYRDPQVPEINAWLTIAPDETVTVRIGQTEIGTGVMTCNA